jgi:phosphoglycolate phosphatase-like HAD superfamily hydrolase
MVGDILDDVEAGRAAGCRTVLLDNGNETEWDVTPERVPDLVAHDFAELAALVLEQELA